MNHPRHEDIIRILNARRQISVDELTDRLGVSEVTVRKDLSFLQELGKLRRTHGGATIVEDNSEVMALPARRLQAAAEKRLIARAAARLLKPDDAVFVDAGSTCAALVPCLGEMPLRVVTNSFEVVAGLSSKEDVALHAVGGNFRRGAGSFIGPTAVSTMATMRVDIAFIGASGISADGVFSSENAIEADFKRTVIASARRRVVLADHRKLGREAFAVFARMGDVDFLITGDTPRAREIASRFTFETMYVSIDSERAD